MRLRVNNEPSVDPQHIAIASSLCDFTQALLLEEVGIDVFNWEVFVHLQRLPENSWACVIGYYRPKRNLGVGARLRYNGVTGTVEGREIKILKVD